MVAVYLLFISSCLSQWSGGNAFTPAVYKDKSLPSSWCASNLFEDDEQLMETLKMIHQQLPPPGCNPPTTCAQFLRCNSSASSGYYQIQAANGSAVQVYCDMEGTHCGGEGGWMRVAYLNMTDPSSQCPVGFRVETATSIRFCIRNTSSAGCRSIIYNSFGVTYSQICGRVRGYSFATTDGFHYNVPLNGSYADGVSITYGTPPTHVWTYASGHQETGNEGLNCPCNTPPGTSPPSYVGSSYYCESGSPNNPNSQLKWHTSDPLWDGMQCGGDERPCCNPTGLPWFNKNLLTPLTADINVRLCVNEITTNENIGIERLELYIK